MVYPVEVFRTGNGLFIQGKYRPAVMAVLNIALDIILVKPFGILGVLLATTFSRLFTQVWFDPYLIYKFVFKSSVKKYLLDYIYKTFQAVAICSAAYLLSNLISISNVFLNFIIRGLIAFLISNLAIIFFYRDNTQYLMAKKKIINFCKRYR